MSFPHYGAYKDSGVEWLGEVPTHWKTTHLKRLCLLITDGAHVSPETEGGVFPFVSTKDIFNDEINFGDSLMTTATSYEYLVKTGCRPMAGDVLFSKDGTIGRTVLVREPLAFVVASSLIIIRPDPIGLASTFLNYLCKSDVVSRQVESFVKGAGLPRLSIQNLLKVIGIFPPLEEQCAIAAFLDRETTKIDELVTEQRNLIVLLKEKRQALISHAVTKGLDPAAPMKDSGVEWLGEVPAHWVVGAIKRFVRFLDGCRIPLSSEERSTRSGQFPYYGASGVIDYVDDFIFDEDLVLVSEDGANLLNRSTPISFVARGRYWVNNHAHILRPPDAHPDFWAERIEAIDLVPVVTGSAQPKLTIEALANLKIAVPPLATERAEIEEFLTSRARNINALVAEAETTISLLHERRTALISAAVTGKIDVRQSALVREEPSCEMA